MENWQTHKRQIIPGLFTSFNLLCGSFSIFFSIDQNPAAASWMIIMAVLFDGLDGKIARLVQCESQFGLQFDSLADMVSSGIAPAVLVYQAYFGGHFHHEALILPVFIFCAAFRLARFNAVQKGDRSNGYTGLPIPVAGMSLAALYLFNDALSLSPDLIWIEVCVMSLSLLMAGTIPYAWPKLDFSNVAKFVWSAIYLGCVVMMIFFTKYSLFPLLFLYIIAGIVRWIRDLIRESSVVELIK